MPRLQTLIDAETQLATARGLMEIVHFFYDHASDEDWVRLRGSLGFVFNVVSDKLHRSDRKVEQMFAERNAGKPQGTSH